MYSKELFHFILIIKSVSKDLNKLKHVFKESRFEKSIHSINLEFLVEPLKYTYVKIDELKDTRKSPSKQLLPPTTANWKHWSTKQVNIEKFFCRGDLPQMCFATGRDSNTETYRYALLMSTETTIPLQISILSSERLRSTVSFLLFLRRSWSASVKVLEGMYHHLSMTRTKRRICIDLFSRQLYTRKVSWNSHFYTFNSFCCS